MPRSDAIPAAIALGSNVGDRCGHLVAAFAAIASLPGTRIEARSSVFETLAVALPGSTDDPGGSYLNAAAVLSTRLSARELLDHLLAIERSRGRDRTGKTRWGPRTLDLDLLLYGDAVIDEPGLIIPHPRLHERLFVLDPLAEIAPGWRVPTLNRTVTELRAALGPQTPDPAGATPPCAD